VADPSGVRVFKYAAGRGTETPRWKAAVGDADHRLLLRAVTDQPDEDVPRLVYADWLEENGDPGRAEFIRLDVRHAQRLRDGPVPAGDPEEVRRWELERAFGARWLAECPAVHGIHWDGFWRGFPVVRVGSPA